jgi:ABC-type Fe3+/spermidine/putrescine transport system ATPase subunit
MRDGLIEQLGTPDEIYNLPRSAFVADFIGSSNLIRGRNRRDLARDDTFALETVDGRIVHGTAYGRHLADEIVASVRTVHLRISPQPPAAQQNVWPVEIEQTVFQGDFSQVLIRWGEQRLTARCAAMDPIAPSGQMFMSIDPRRVVLLSA